MASQMANDPLLCPGPQSRLLFPIKYKKIWQLYEDTRAQFWGPEDIDFTQDVLDWEGLTDPEKHFLQTIAAFFLRGDSLVMENISANFESEIQIPESKQYYAYQKCIEAIHWEVYALIVEMVIQDPERKRQVIEDEIPCVRDIVDWAERWMNGNRTFAERLVAFAVFEGMFFQTKFPCIFWLKRKGFPGLIHANFLIARDEASHEDHAVELHSLLQDKASPENIRQIIMEAVELDIRFMEEALHTPLIGINSNMISDYVRFVADRLLVKFGCPREYNVAPNSLHELMETMGTEVKVSQFEHRVHVYSSAQMGDTSRLEDVFDDEEEEEEKTE